MNNSDDKKVRFINFEEEPELLQYIKEYNDRYIFKVAFNKVCVHPNNVCSFIFRYQRKDGDPICDGFLEYTDNDEIYHLCSNSNVIIPIPIL